MVPQRGTRIRNAAREMEVALFDLKAPALSATVNGYLGVTLIVAGFLQELVKRGEEFVTEDYMLPTPDWAVYDAPEAGFDPMETRVKKIRRHPGKADV